MPGGRLLPDGSGRIVAQDVRLPPSWRRHARGDGHPARAFLILRSRAFVRHRRPSSFLLLVQEKPNQREGHPAFAPALRVCESEPGFSTVLPELTKTRARPVRARCAALSSPTHRYRGDPKSTSLLLLPLFAGEGWDGVTLALWIPWERRVAQVERGYRRVRGGKRRACLRPWMAEFAPAAGFRATQGMAAASSPPRGLRVGFLLVTFHCRKKEKLPGSAEGDTESFCS